MLNICTLSDNNYLLKGLALLESLRNTCSESFTLHYLCLDQKTFNVMFEQKNVIAYYLPSLEKQFPELQKAKNNPLSLHARSQQEQYIWSLTPFFINYLIKEFNEPIIYIDSDIIFYQDISELAELVKIYPLSIHTHRFGGSFKEINTGWFNVGVLFFNGSKESLKFSELWAEWCLNPNNEYYKKYGTCGDQKYLEIFYKFHRDSVCVFDEMFNIGHLAPWNSDHLKHYQFGEIQFAGRRQKIWFYHFSHFVFKVNSYSDSWHGEWKPTRDQNIKKYYDDYFNRLKNINEKLQVL